MVRRKNMLSVLMQCFSLTCMMSVLWYVVGYSLSFSANGRAQPTLLATSSTTYGTGARHVIHHGGYRCPPHHPPCH